LLTEGGSVAGEVNETALDVGADEFDVNLLAHVETLEPARQSSFNGRLQKPDPRAFVRGAGDDGIEFFPNP
jgi:hypothetical protein